MSDQPFAEYLRSENAKERAEGGADSPSVEIVETPEAQIVSAEPAATSESSETPTPENEASASPAADSADAKAAEGDRNPDGTFKKRSAKNDATAADVPRIRELTYKLRERERELETLRAQVSQGQAPAAASPALTPPTAPSAGLDPNDPKPTLKQFLDAEDPYEALAVEAALWAVRESNRKGEHERAARAAQQAQIEAQSRVEAFVADHPDYFDRVTAIDDIQFPREVLTAIAEDPAGPAVAYHLASHPEEARRISTLRPLDGVKAIGQLLSRVAGASSGSPAPAPVVSKAKPLIKPVSASPTAPAPANPSELPFGPRYIAEMNRLERRQREALRG